MASTYDRVPYRTRPRRATHPETFATMARLAGLDPAPVTRCRVLDVGCGTGDNLLAMAWALPDSQFLGIDPSRGQIDMARAEAARLALPHVRFEAIGIEDLLATAGGPFDYIVCHGVFSWVPGDVQGRLLTACRRHLAPRGVAMISYNTYPGWHLRAIGRDAMTFLASSLDDPAEQVGAARSYLRFLAGAVPDRESAIAGIYGAEADRLDGRDDAYIYHEHFEATNSPCYFHEFMARADGAGLQYLGEAGRHWALTGLSPDTRRVIERLSRSRIDLEQHCDFIWNRAFRHTLLVRDDAAIDPERGRAALPGLLARAASVAGAGAPATRLTDTVTYRGADGAAMSTDSPLMNAILGELAARWPLTMDVAELSRRALDRVAAERPAEGGEATRALPGAVLELSAMGFLTLHVWQAAFATTVSERPRAWPIAAHVARRDRAVPTLTHQSIDLTAFECFVLSHCNGGRDRRALVLEAERAVRAGALPAPEGGAEDAVDQALRGFASWAVLIG